MLQVVSIDGQRGSEDDRSLSSVENTNHSNKTVANSKKGERLLASTLILECDSNHGSCNYIQSKNMCIARVRK